ncbi:YcjF family protein [Synechococcus sp. PCC 6312]|uniref:YcjF family protein n=1 Tax=Synechococcus sp. (strain ATCC 27167 / PCC 6312) TaxID=195253 RepID=UPI00029ED104|nr:GTP-binding protein [Synechococcus sp. PCC 6312]AFY62766.1 small GTP-binding protein domain protein [Synechococcus sp. PCC 6312]
MSRSLLLILGLGIVLGLMLWLVAALHGLYVQIAFSSPLLANILLVVLILVFLALLYALIHYLGLVRQTKARKPRPQAPVEKTEAAVETLEALQKQLNQVEDEVARLALQAKARELEHSFSRQHIRLVVFGTGSAGKTSLVNAIVGKIVGEVSAPMGTTTMGATYCLQLRGIDQDIWITDTPGILEAGIAGTEREQQARQLATEADLLLFVLDNDLRQSEYLPLVSLVEMGKRSLVVLNKIDRMTSADRDLILAQLRHRLQGIIAAPDVVAIAAAPQPIILDNGNTVIPDPDILPVLKRIAAILRAEGQDLVADNILLQSQRLGEEARRLIDRQRKRQADKIVERYQWIGAGVICVTPIPVVDLLAAAAVNAQMVVEIGRVYGCDLNAARGRELALSLGRTLASLGIVKGAMDLVATALQLSVGGIVVGRAIQSIGAAYLTRIAGKSFIEYFRQDQDWGDGGMSEVVQQQFQLNRRDEFIQAFIQEAITKLPDTIGRAINRNSPAKLDKETP